MAFGSYCDEFGHHQDPTKRVMGIAGLLAWTDSWDRFNSEWKQLLEHEGIPNPFHMTDFVHHKKQFKDWDSPQRRLVVLGNLLKVIKKANVIPIAAAVVLKDFNSLTAEQQSQLKGPYYVAFQQVSFQIGFAATMLALHSSNPLEHSVSMSYARLKKFTGPAEQLWQAIKKHNPHVGPWMGSYTAADPIDCLPLQAADIWAYSLGHMHEHHPAKNYEAGVAYQFFLREAMKHEIGHSFYEVFDRETLLTKLE